MKNHLSDTTNPLREVLKALTGVEPPVQVSGYKFKLEDSDVIQAWAVQHVKPNYLTGIGLMEAAEALVESAVSNGNIPRPPQPTVYRFEVYYASSNSIQHLYDVGKRGDSESDSEYSYFSRTLNKMTEVFQTGASRVKVTYQTESGAYHWWGTVTNSTGTFQESLMVSELLEKEPGRGLNNNYVYVNCPGARRILVLSKALKTDVLQLFKFLRALEAHQPNIFEGYTFTITNDPDESDEYDDYPKIIYDEGPEGDCQCAIKEWGLTPFHCTLLMSLISSVARP